MGLYAAVMIAIRIPQVQQYLGAKASQAIGGKLGTKVEVGQIDLGFLNRLILDNVVIYDQQQQRMVSADRITARVDLPSLAIGKVSISSAQLFGAHFQLYKATKDAQANFQFALDSLASKDTINNTPLDLRINSLIVRRSSVSYNQLDEPKTQNRLNVKHLNISNISAHAILKTLTDDSINVNLKRLSFTEQSGLSVKRMSFLLAAGRQDANLQQLALQLPNSDVRIDSIAATYQWEQFWRTLRMKGAVSTTHIMPADLKCLLPAINDYPHKIALASDFSFDDYTLHIHKLQAVSDNSDIDIAVSGRIRKPERGPTVWQCNADHINVDGSTINFISRNIVALPDPALRLEYVQLHGTLSGDNEGTLNAQADITTGIGNVNAWLLAGKDKLFSGNVKSDGFDIGKLLDNNKVGLIAADLALNGTSGQQIAAKGRIDMLQYEDYAYRNIELNGNYASNQLTGGIQIADPRLSAQLQVNIMGKTINDAVGTVSLHNLRLPEKDYHLDYLQLESGFEDGRHFLTLNSDFAHADLTGEFDYTTLAQSLVNAVGSVLPALPGLPPIKETAKNNFTFKMMLGKTDWLQKLAGIDLNIQSPVSLSTTVNDNISQVMVDLKAQAFSYNGAGYRDCNVHIFSPNDTLFFKADIATLTDEEETHDFSLSGNAANNVLDFSLAWDNNSQQKPVKGVLNAAGLLYRNLGNEAEAHFRILPSAITIDKSVWQIEPSDILYSTNRLLVDHFAVHNDDQHIRINGVGSKQKTDSLFVDLRNVEVADVLELIDFESVSFAGKASGRATLASAFDALDASANLRVDQFKFEHGRMGTLYALIDWNKQKKQIDINATTNDGLDAVTYINGYVSPERKYLDLGISAHGTYIDFLHNYTKSVFSDITGHATGNVRVAGPFSAVDLTGDLIVDADATVKPLNTTYHLRKDTITMTYTEIAINKQAIYDKYDNVGYLSGAIRHQHLKNMYLDLHLSTDKILGYDFQDFGDLSFYGTVFAAGDVDIRVTKGNVNIDCEVTPLENSVFVYNAANPDAINTQEFITWVTAPTAHEDAPSPTLQSAQNDQSGNIYMNFLINATPDATMRLLMDARTNDYITLNGNGIIQASYYNKGTFQMFGTYTVSSGTYDVTIQNIINKKFQFQPDGTITFGGNPYSAALNLQALYTVNGVSLSDLNIGNSFASNTVRVNCLMNIGGQPSSPRVTFDLDLPTVNADEKQMVRSLLSSQQEMNQQVLYLLGIGRFYNQGQNNAGQQDQQNQTALAMQSFLSGTLSTQLNNVINQFVKTDNWNFGANISTGTEGWNNAEYEGIINGRMLNNRLLINGQFGYRDNATHANPSFIGDFDVRYLLTPNGNYALKVYNQTNDRYFTRSSLNTQGIGFIIKKDFNSFSDFWNWKK